MTDSPAQQTAEDAQLNARLPSVTNKAFLTTRTGFEFSVRPVEPFDEPKLAALFGKLDPADMRFRFLSQMKQPSQQMFNDMIAVDHDHRENYLAVAIDGETLIASAVVAADAANEIAEVAIAMNRDYKGRGVGWTLLQFIIEKLKHKGVKKLQSIESRENHQAILLEREMGFKASSYPGDGSVVLLEFDLTHSRV